MRVVLINAPLYPKTVRRLKVITENLFYNSACLGLGYLAAVLEKEKHEVKIIDAPAEGFSIDEVIRSIAGFSPDIAGLSVYTVSALSSYELAAEIKKKFPGVKIVSGGPHMTANPEELLKHPQLDIAVLGEGEITFAELVRSLKNGNDINAVKGLAYNDKGEVLYTHPREYIADLDILPFPARHLLAMHLYRPQPSDQKRLPKLSMITSRGCPNNCIFCDKNVFKSAYRSFSPKYIVNEMRHLVAEYRAKDIAFVDSTFTPDKERVYGVINEIKNSGLDVTWTCSVRVDILDRDLLKSMKDAGCWRIRLGIESGNEGVLKFIKKGITKSSVRKVAQWAYELDLEPKGFFMIGHLTDTKETIRETIDFACALPLKDITVQINTPLKKTPQYDLTPQFGRILTQDSSYYDFWEPVFLPKGLSRQQLLDYYRKFYLKFYLRPRIWFWHLVKIRTVADILKYLRGIKIMLFFMTTRTGFLKIKEAR